MSSRAGMSAGARRQTAVLRNAGKNRKKALFDAIHTKGQDVASASTITLIDPYCEVTGTVTIAAITELPEGQVRNVRFTGAGTITYNATSMILPGAANITRAANDIAEFTSLGGGNWACSKYTLANGTVLGVVTIPHGGTSNITAVTAIDALHTAGSDIASGSTVNLDTATGQVVSITGSTAITAFTLAEGKVRRCRFKDSPAPKITYSSSAILINGSADIQGAQNDTFEVVGKASSIVEVRNYVRAAVSPLVANVFTANCRLTMTSGTPITGSITGDNVYVTPFRGNQMPLYNGTEWKSYSFSEITLEATKAFANVSTTNGQPTLTGINDTSHLIIGMSLSGTNIPGGATISAITSATALTMSGNATGTGTITLTAKIPVDKNVDVFGILTSSGTVDARFGNIWSGDTTRAVAIGVNSTSGLYVNSAALHSGDFNQISANQGTYLGSVRTPLAGKMTTNLTWNYYNRIQIPRGAIEATNSWNYSNTAYQQANANTANGVAFLIGVAEDTISARVLAHCINSTATSRLVGIGIGFDSTTINSAFVSDSVGVTNAQRRNLTAEYIDRPAAGYHVIAWLEAGAGTDTQTWFGNAGGVLLQTGMTAIVWG